MSVVSGPKSYYDEYIRKKGASRTLSDPPSLLTDRGAYVNFLEVQLERVSAACLGVQAYDSRFNDMQSLIVALDERCGNTTRLVSLAQQCTEELRTECNQNLSNTKHDLQREIDQVQSAFKELYTRLAAVEQGVASSKVTEQGLDRRVLAMEDALRATDKRHAESEAALRLETGAHGAQISSLHTDVEHLKTLKDDIRSVEKGLIQKMTGVETNLVERQASDRDEFNRRLTILQNQLTNFKEEEETRHLAADEKIELALERGEEGLKRGSLYRDRLNEHFDMLEKVGERIGFLEVSVGDLRREEGRPLEGRLEKKLADKMETQLKQRFGDLDAWADGFEKRVDNRLDSIRTAIRQTPVQYPPAGDTTAPANTMAAGTRDASNSITSIGASVLAGAGPVPGEGGAIRREVFTQFIDMYEAELSEVRGRLAALGEGGAGSGPTREQGGTVKSTSGLDMGSDLRPKPSGADPLEQLPPTFFSRLPNNRPWQGPSPTEPRSPTRRSVTLPMSRSTDYADDNSTSRSEMDSLSVSQSAEDFITRPRPRPKDNLGGAAAKVTDSATKPRATGLLAELKRRKK